MTEQMQPFNLELLFLNNNQLARLNQIKTLDITEGNSNNFHPDGLFSIDIFGKVAEVERSRTFAYINLKTSVLHPLIYEQLINIKGFYDDIMSGKKYAKWDEEIKDFLEVSPLEGDTGYHFFISHINDLNLIKNESEKRSFSIDLINKYKPNLFVENYLVLPAGLRDYEIQEDGRPLEGEINTHYRTLMIYANLINPIVAKNHPDSIDSSRYKIQKTLEIIFDYFRNLVEGKYKLIGNNWTKRAIFNGTRNVITSAIESSNELHEEGSFSYNDTLVGLYQASKALLPITIFNIKNGFLSEVFNDTNSPAILVNKKTLKKELVQLNSNYYNDWFTSEGIEKLLTRFAQEDLRHKPLVISDHYLGLIYKDDKCFKLFHDIDDLPKAFDKKNVYPITFAELIYCSIFKVTNKYPALVTRYPVTGYGSVYPSRIYLKTTVKAKKLYELDFNWELTNSLALQFPIQGERFYNSMSPHPSKLPRLGGDFDGDTCSLNVLTTEEAIEENNRVLDSAAFYVSPHGGMYFSAESDTINFVLAYMSS